jgi:alkaline phosphatase
MPRNVILLIGDGMGFAQMQAASLYAHGDKGKLFLQTLPAEAKVRTYPASGP